jgi:3-hydroxyisobutyrate dehydrogenase-like beta-hydroxyacid dehydrogenase
MGARIATRLVREGFNPTVYDVADVAVRMFTNDVGGMMSGSPKMLGQCCDIVMTVLSSAADLRDVLFGWQGLASGLRHGSILIDMSSADPRDSIELAKRLAERGIEMIDAPAIGSPADARAGKLSLIVGGDPTAVQRCQAGAAIGDFLRGAGILAATEALRIGQSAGLRPEQLIEIATTLGGAGPLVAEMLRSQVLSRKFDSGLALGHVLKGIEVTDGAARSAGIYAPLVAACRLAWTEAQASIGSGADQTELLRWLEVAVGPQAPHEAPQEA